MIHKDKGVTISHGFRIRTEPLQETVYRYRAINDWLRNILENDELYFATPESCNDPFDCRFDASLEDPVAGLKLFLEEQARMAKMFESVGHSYDGLLQHLIDSKALAAMDESALTKFAEQLYNDYGLGSTEHQLSVKQRIESARNQIGICCFAGRFDNVLMHAHYSNQHSGCCLEFQIRNEEGHRQSIFEENGLLFWDVKYQNELAVVPLYETGTLDSIQKIVLTKSVQWSYEEEIRVVRFAGPGVVKYQRTALTGLIFGYRTSKADIDKVTGWLGDRPGVSLSKVIPAKDGRLVMETL